jgi:protoporphyrinogen oxidase
LARRRSPAKSVFDVLKTALVKSDENVSAENFLYPKKGYGVMCQKLAEKILAKDGELILDSFTEEMFVKKGKLTSVKIKSKNGKTRKIDCDVLVSTMSITELPLLIKGADLGTEEKNSLQKLKFRSLVIAYVFLKKKQALKDNWIFFPEREFCFNRVAEQKSFSPFTCPEDKTVLTAEITCDFGDKTYNSSEEEIKERVVRDLVKAGLIKEAEVYDFIIRKAGRVYPVYDLDYKTHLNSVLSWLDRIENIYTVGRLGLFNYNNADHCLDMAKVTAQVAISNNREEWKKAREYFDSYRIVD